ncbi:hypothetical protein KC717_04925 [Candidatus Dojkabacteria bacterium]|uniref:DAHP synthetase I/KDSA domain-containing protein n=1 Tax=Candidatus Dojkabacteria bacterium TaxID=2099670 RepID=A0A955RKN5_9BACT|nr:hypothetical protein [Candidatus Dojkabacteria bacterium]
MKNSPVRIIAGPCSIDEQNISEVHQIAELSVKGKPAIAGTRIVGLKSRTFIDISGNGMGMDYEAFMKNIAVLNSGGSSNDFVIPPSVELAEKIHAKTGMLIATEIMVPSVQLPSYNGKLNGALMPWNPSVNQLGWQVMQTAQFAANNNWVVGIKNGKWIGESLDIVERKDYGSVSPMEKTWVGLAKYAGEYTKDVILIHRGVDVPEKGDFRNAVVHQLAKRAKQHSGAKLYFDPSHSYGPKMREDIVEATIDALKMKIREDEYLYDGVLIESGTSQTDTEQHITISELRDMINEISSFRELDSGKRMVTDINKEIRVEQLSTGIV